MKRRFISLFISLILICAALPVFPAQAAHSGTCGVGLTWTLDDAGTLTISGTGAMEDWTSYSYVPWYSYRTKIEGVSIGDRVSSIGDYAFDYCNNLKTVQISEDVTRIGRKAFAGCTCLTDITLPGSLRTIDYGAFWSSGLKNIRIPEGVISIGGAAFIYCNSLTNVYLPDSLKTIESNAFSGSAISTIYIPCGVESIANTAFTGCSNLSRIDVSEDNNYYSAPPNDYVLFNKQRTVLCYFPSDRAEAIPTLYTYYVPEGVNTIGACAFYGAKDIMEIDIPEGVTYIESDAFGNCNSIKKITLPASLMNLDSSVFSSSSLEEIHYGGTKEEWNDLISDYDTDIFENVTITYLAATRTPCGEGLKWVLDDAGTLTIRGTGAMTDWGSSLNVPWDPYRSKIKTVFIEDGVSSIGSFAFYDCSSLTRVTIPESVTSIGDYAFRGCSGLTSVTIPDSVTSIGSRAFWYCSSLTSINVSSNNSIYASKDGVLFDKNMTSLICCPGGRTGEYTIPDSVTSIGSYAFYVCSRLTSVTIPDSVTSIDSWAFGSCSSLTSVIIPDSVTSIGSRAFGSCFRLTSVTIPDSVTSIENSAFVFCNSLKDVYYGGSESDWADIDIQSGNTELTSAEIHFTEYPYLIGELSLLSETGAELGSAPLNSSFVVNVSLTETDARENVDYLFITVYDRNGRMLSLDYVSADFIKGTAYSFGFHVPAQAAEIGTIKAYVLDSFSDIRPLAKSKEI